MRVIVIGLGDVGRHVARTLSAERHDVTIVDSDPARVEAAQGELDALVIAGNGASPKLLTEIGAGRADLVCGVTQSDEVNVIAALASRQLGAGRTVARVRDPDYFGTGEALTRDVLGIDFVINPERATADDLAEAILVPGAVHVEHFGDGRIAIAELILTPRSPLDGRSVGDEDEVRPHTIFGLMSDGRALAVAPGHRLRAGDHILVAAARDDIASVVSHLAGKAPRVREVVIFGGGRVGLPLARRLGISEGLDVMVMESDAARARFVAERVRDVTVLHEEGVSKDVLVMHGVDRAGAFVACAGDDRANLLAALHAKQLGAELCLAVVSREEFTPLVDALGIDAAFSPRLVTAEAILGSIRGSTVHSMYLLLGGAEVIEVEARPGCRAASRSISSVETLARTHVAAILRRGRVLMPQPDMTFEEDDRVVLFNPRRGVANLDRSFGMP